LELLVPIRSEKRLVIALPIRVYGMGGDGKPFTQEARTVDVTREGARVAGVPQIATVGEIVGVQYGEAKARFKVMWVGPPGTDKEGHIGIQTLQEGQALWHKILEATPEEVRWVDPGHSSVAPAAIAKPAPAPPPPASDITARVEQATQELLEIEKLIGSGAVDGRILQDFREAVNHIRQTSWAVQRWLELRDKKQDPYGAVDLMVRERIRCATQLSRELGHDIEGSEVDIETEGLSALQVEVNALSLLLLGILGRAKS